MKRTHFLLIPTLMLAVLVLAVAAEVPTVAGPPSGVQKRLEQYSTSAFVKGETHVRLLARAERPWNLTKDLSWLALGDSVYFETDHPLTRGRSVGPSPLPYPPKEVWCALLESEDEATGVRSYAVVLVGLHMDMYSADWMLHQAPSQPFSTAFREALSALGCDLRLR